MTFEILEAVFFGMLVGISLGLTGGGGSILAVPLLFFGLGLPLRAAVAVSLAVVGLTAFYGAVLQNRSGNVLWRAGAILGLGGILAAPLGAAVGRQMSDTLTLFLFSLLMLFIGVSMLRKGSDADTILARFACERTPEGLPKFSPLCAGKLVVSGLLVGILSGIFGVGGGFLVVPAILITAAVSIERALATSLVAIALTSASALAANAAALIEVGWLVPACFLAGSITGLTLGSSWKKKLSGTILRRGFALVVIGVGIAMLIKNLLG